MKSISLKIPDGLEQQLSNAAYTQKTTRSEIVREALEEYLTAGMENHPGTCLSLASDLVGCAEGPADLSSDKRYLDGFGE